MPVCPKCQINLSDDALFCQNCGSPVANHPQAAHSSSGINGWYIPIIIGLIYTMAVNLYRAFYELAAESLVSLILAIIEISIGLFCILCLILMFKRSRLFPRFFISLLITNAVIAVIFIPIILNMELNAPAVALSLVVSVFMSINWIINKYAYARFKDTFTR